MTTTTPTITPVAVQPKHDVPPLAYHVTEENLLELAAILGLTPTHTLAGTRLEVPFERRYNLASSAAAGDVIIRHPGFTVRDLEVLPLARFDEQYERADRDLVDMVVAEEFPDAHAWAIIASGPAGVYALPGRGITDAAHLIGIAELVSRSGRARS